MKATALLYLLFATAAVAQQTQGPLTNERIGGMVLAGVSQGEIIRIIGSAARFNFDLRPNSTDELLKVGVSEDVIKAMAARESGTVLPATSLATRGGSDSTPAIPAKLPTATPAASVTRVAAPMSQPRPRIAGSYEALHESGGHKVSYDGGSIPSLKTGNSVKLYLG